jgi:translation initiation factor IF-2
VGFNVRPDVAARRQSDTDGIEILTYTVIMAMLDDVKAAMAGLLPPVVSENFLGRAEIRQTFTIPKIGTIAGSIVLEGKVVRHSHCRVVRDGVQVYEGTVGSLRRFKDDVREVTNGMECGIGVSTYNDIKIGDVIEAFELEEKPATL